MAASRSIQSHPVDVTGGSLPRRLGWKTRLGPGPKEEMSREEIVLMHKMLIRENPVVNAES